MDYPKVGFQVDGQFYFHTVFPFGLCSATLACQRTTQSIVYILTTMGLLVDMYVDDFYGVATPSHSSNTFQTKGHESKCAGLMFYRSFFHHQCIFEGLM